MDPVLGNLMTSLVELHPCAGAVVHLLQGMRWEEHLLLLLPNARMGKEEEERAKSCP